MKQESFTLALGLVCRDRPARFVKTIGQSLPCFMLPGHQSSVHVKHPVIGSLAGIGLKAGIQVNGIQNSHRKTSIRLF